MSSSTRAQWEAWADGNQDRVTLPAYNMEQVTRHESMAKKEVSRLGTPCRLLIVSHRHRLCDSDGVSAKAAIDGLVHAGILGDDSPEFVKEVSYSQVKISRDKQEKTEILITD